MSVDTHKRGQERERGARSDKEEERLDPASKAGIEDPRLQDLNSSSPEHHIVRHVDTEWVGYYRPLLCSNMT